MKKPALNLHLLLVVAWFIMTLLLVTMSFFASSSSSSSFPEASNSSINKTLSSSSSSSSSLYYRWIPQDEHPCTIRRISFDQLPIVFASSNGLIPPLYHEPLVITVTDSAAVTENSNSNTTEQQQHHGVMRNVNFRYKASLQHILDNFVQNFAVTLSSSNQFSEHRRTITLAQYLNETYMAGKGETYPNQLANETWYLFGETYSNEWIHGLLRHYELPPCVTCHRQSVALSFGIGNRGSGVQWHTHGPGFSEAIHGQKHWVLYPPNQRPHEFHKDQSSRAWMEYVYPTLGTISTPPKPYECTLDPGDLIYFPDRWWHATINLDPYTAFISTFTTEHNVDIDDDYMFINDQQGGAGERYDDSFDLSTQQHGSGEPEL